MKHNQAMTITLGLAILLLIGCLVSLNVNQAIPANASGKVDGYATYAFLAAVNTASAETDGTAKVVADYGWLDCYYTVTLNATAQRVTMTLMHSPDATLWVSATEAFSMVNSIGSSPVTYLGVPVSGTYMKAHMSLWSAGNVTATVKCTAKDLTR